MSNKKPIANGVFTIQKFEGKGAWHYVSLPGVPPAPNTAFGWRKVSGQIDNYFFDNMRLMPLGNGMLFLPLKQALRKTLGKTTGDTVAIVLFETPIINTLTPELLACFEQESPKSLAHFNTLTTFAKQRWIEWIYDAKNEDQKAQRIIVLLDKMQHAI